MTLEESFTVPGIYIAASNVGFFLYETDEKFLQHQLNSASLEQDGVLSRDGWNQTALGSAVVGPLQRKQ